MNNNKYFISQHVYIIDILNIRVTLSLAPNNKNIANTHSDRNIVITNSNNNINRLHTYPRSYFKIKINIPKRCAHTEPLNKLIVNACSSSVGSSLILNRCCKSRFDFSNILYGPNCKSPCPFFLSSKDCSIFDPQKLVVMFFRRLSTFAKKLFVL